jgi:hypothetical protein
MPQFDFYFNDEDRKDLFNFIQLKGGKLIPDLLYKSDEYIVISDYDEFLNYIENESTHFLLIDEKFLIEPLLLTKNRFIEETEFGINQRKGGPYIDISFYKGYSDDSIIACKKSVVDIYSKFIYLKNSDEFKATEDLKAYYNEIVSYIKGKCTSVKIDNKKYWISIEQLPK